MATAGIDYADLAPRRPSGDKRKEPGVTKARMLNISVKPPVDWILDQLRERELTRGGRPPSTNAVINRAVVELGLREGIKVEDWPLYGAYMEALTRAQGGRRLRASRWKEKAEPKGENDG